MLTTTSGDQWLSQEWNAGFRQMTWDGSWSAYEPSQGVFSSTEFAFEKSKMDEFKAAGYMVSYSVNFGQSTPSWVYGLPNARLSDQFGDQDGVNLIWNQPVRDAAAVFLQRLVSDFGPGYFYAIRVGFAPDAGEMLYPESNAHPNSLWAYDALAQNGGGAYAQSPMPGWHPGDTTWNGQPVTTSQVDQWYQWYVNGLTSAGNWETSVLTAAGFCGWYQWLFATTGVLPTSYTSYVNSYLTNAGTFTGDPRPRGGAYNLMIAGIADRSHAQVQNTGIGDGNGGNTTCQSGDDSVAISDPQIDNWSGGRWTSYLADTNGGMAKTAENPGPHDSLSTAQAANSIFLSCGMQVWYYSHDFSLFDGTAGAATVNDLANIIASSGGP